MMRAIKLTLVTILSAALCAPIAAQQVPGSGRYDSQILSEVQSYLQGNKSLSNVHATVKQGVVTLTGSVGLYYDKANAEQKIHSKGHVAGVRDDVTVTSTVPDEQLQNKLADKLRYDHTYPGTVFNTFSLGVRNGVVTLSGSTRTYASRDSAINLVETTPGVKEFIDKVKVAPLSPFDDAIRFRVARAVYGRLPMYANDPQDPIRIVVANGNVALDGVVNSQIDKQVAFMAASEVPGVYRVTNNLAVSSGK